MIHILGKKEIPVYREIRINIPQELAEFVEQKIKASLPGFCQKLLCDMLYQAQKELETKRMESKEDSVELAKQLLNSKEGVLNVNINK